MYAAPRLPLSVPVLNGHVVTIEWDELPEYASLSQLLINETPPLSCWLQIIAHYMRTNNDADLEKIFKDSAPPAPGEKLKGFNRIYEKNFEDRALIYNAHAMFRLKQARQLRRQFFMESAQKRDAKGTIDEKKNHAVMECFGFAEKMAKLAAETLAQDKMENSKNGIAAVAVTQGELLMFQAEGEITAKAMDLLEKARQHFDRALHSRPHTLTALMNKAHVMFRKGAFKEALALYARVCLLYPHASAAAVRVGLGMCHYELNQESRAQECFERALELDPTSIDAQAGLAVIELGLASEADRAVGLSSDELIRNQERAKELSSRALERLQNAYAKEKHHPLVLLHLANHFFHERDYDKCENLAQDAYYYSQSHMIQAEAMYIMGRSYHEQNDFSRADQYYNSSISLADQANTRFTLAHFASAQMQLYRNNPSLAITAVETVMETPEGKDDEDCAMMLGSLRASDRQQQNSALQLLRRVTDKNPHYAEAWIQQASIEEAAYRTSASAAEDAVRSYEKAQASMRLKGEDVPMELWNNLGVLKYRLGNYAGALQAFKMAMDAAAGGSGSGGVDPLTMPLETANVTCVFNCARTLEATGALVQAERLYQRLRQAVPDYLDATLRLACIQKSRGQWSKAEELLQDVVGHHPQCVDAWLLFGAVEMDRGAYNAADKKFERVVNIEGQKHDEYARLSMANVAFHDAQANRGEKERDVALSKALAIYRAMLKAHPTNIFAANGIGACQALRHRHESARQIFDRVREVSDAMCPSAWVNLAHTMMFEREFHKAVIMYEQISKRFFEDRDWEVLFYLANALFLSGNQMKETRQVLLRALKLQPNEESLWFALATVDEADAVRVLALDANLRSLGQVDQAIATLERALGVYEWLSAKASKAVATPTYPVAGPSASFPHRPQSPPGAPLTGESASAVLMARARAALCELRGESPAPADAQLRAESDASVHQALLENRTEARLQGHRTLLERAAHRRNPNLAKLAAAAGKRFAAVKSELVASVTAQQVQAKTERRQVEEKKRQEEARIAADKRSAQEKEEQARRDAVEAEALREKAARLAEENKALASKMAVRRSTRHRKKSRKLLESAQARDDSESGEESAADESDEEAAQQQQPEDDEAEMSDVGSDDDVDEARKQALGFIKEFVASSADPLAITYKSLHKAMGESMGDVVDGLNKDWVKATLLGALERHMLADAVKRVVAEHPEKNVVETLEMIATDGDVGAIYKSHATFVSDLVVVAKGGVAPERKGKRKIRKADDEDDEEEFDKPAPLPSEQQQRESADVEMTDGPAAATAPVEPPIKKSRVIDDDDD